MNWIEKPTYAAVVCSNTLPTKYGTLTGGPCTKSSIKMNGNLNTDGVISVTLKSGDEVTSTVEVSQTVEYAHAITIAFEVLILLISIYFLEYV